MDEEVLECLARWVLLMRILERQEDDKSDLQLLSESDDRRTMRITKGRG